MRMLPQERSRITYPLSTPTQTSRTPSSFAQSGEQYLIWREKRFPGMVKFFEFVSTIISNPAAVVCVSDEIFYLQTSVDNFGLPTP